MKHTVIWSKDAADKLAEIVSYIKSNSGKITAGNVYKKITDKVNNASENAEGNGKLV